MLELSSLMQWKFYAFWSYEIDNQGLFITPKFHQYDTANYSKYLKDISSLRSEAEVNKISNLVISKEGVRVEIEV